MKIPAIDAPLSLGKSFWAVYCLLAIPSLWLLQPWTWGLPLYAEVAGAFLPPFLAGIALYSFVLFTISLTRNFGGQKRALAELLASIVGPAVFVVIAWIFSDHQALPSICAFVVSFIGYALLARMYYRIYRKEPIQPPQTTTGSSAPDRV